MNPSTFYQSLQRPARIGLIVGVVALLAVTGAVLWWVLSPREQLLFGNMKERDAAEVVASLTEWKVPHSITDGGTAITVPADAVYETRMRLVSAGIPRGGHVGFELFDDSDFGVTEFAQRVNYQRALQGEIERTIAALPGVSSARVHLTIRRPGLFADQRDDSKASVALSLEPGQSLTRKQINGVRSLVAASVEGLAPHQVSVLDSDGGLLAGASADAMGDTDLQAQSDEDLRLENRLKARIVDLLGQVLHNEEFRVSVEATLNFDAVREVNERPLAQGTDGNGLLANRRVSHSGGTEGAQNQNQEESSYVHGTARQEIARAPGRVESLSVAVILPPQLDDSEVERVRSLVAAVAGINELRGDRLAVSRLGRDQRWDESRNAAHDLPTLSSTSAPPAAPLPPTAGQRATPWLRWALVAGAAALLGALAILATVRRPKRLSPRERDAVLARMRGWLAEGGTP
ncbi:flagellar M-ring protein FliF [Paracidovorax citrulli]